MFTQFTVKNFRGFADMTLQNLSRVNLISGKNNTGKTALLEAVQLHTHPNDCQLPITINSVRGIEEPMRDFVDVVSWLFYGKRPDVGLHLSSRDEKAIERTLSLYIMDAATARDRFPEAVKSLTETFPIGQWHSLLGGLILRYEQHGEPPRFSWGASNQFGGMWSLGSRIPWSIPSIYLGSGMPSREQDVKFFGELEAAKRQAEVIPPLQILEPRLQRLALVPLAGSPSFGVPGLTTTTAAPIPPGGMPSASPGFQPAPSYQTGQPIIHGDIGLPRMIPMPLMGEGVRRVLSIVLAIANARGGEVLIDEIENGLHYSVQKKVWQAIAEAARQADVQIFATTHSWECIQAAHHAFKEAPPYEFRYFRLDRRGNEITVKGFDERMLDAVEKSDLEAR